MEMNEEIWKRLTQDLLMVVLARLPMESIVRFRAVCKSWKEMLQSAKFRELVATSAVSSSEAFLIVRGRKQLTSLDSSQPLYVRQLTSLDSSQPLYVKNLWIGIESGYKFQRLSLDFLPNPVVVVAGCKNILCCWSGKDEIYICNPVIQTWIELPERIEDTAWDFISLAFDTSTAHCTLIMGRNPTEDVRVFDMWNAFGEGPSPERGSTSQNFMVVEMYDSKTNMWTQLEITVGNLVRPQGEGIHSNGIYYWLNELPDDGDCLSIVAFDEQHKQWNVIKGPQNVTVDIVSRTLGGTFVTGCEGRIVLVCVGHKSLWELSIDEVEGEKWCPFKTVDVEHELRNLMFCMDMAVNHSGCALVFLPMTHVFAVWSEEANILQKIELGQVADFSEYIGSHISVRRFQVNNIFWP